MMQCRDIDELMVEYLYQELDPARAAEFETHVQTCARCGAELGSLQRTRQALRALPEAEPPPALSARLLHEAGRRAPNREGSGFFAWLGRLFQPIVAHPAWAAAASVVLLLAVTTLVSVRARVSPHLDVDLDRSASPPLSAGAPAAPAAAPALLPPDQPVAEKAPEGTVAGGAESGEAAKDPTVRGYLADKSEHRGRSASDDEQKALQLAKGKAAEIRRDAISTLAPGTAAHSTESKPAEAAPAPAKPAPPPAKAAKKEAPARTPAEEAQAPADGYAVRERTADETAADQKMRAKDEVLRSQGSSVVAQAPADTKPEAPAQVAAAEPAAAPPPPPAAPAPSSQPNATGSANAQTATTEGARGGDANKNDAPKADASKGGKARNEAAGSGNAQATNDTRSNSQNNAQGNAPNNSQNTAQNNAPATKNVQPANGESADNDRAAAASTPTTQAQNGPEPPEQQLYRQAQKQAAGGQCADALTLTKKIEKMNPDFYKKRVAGDRTIQSCSQQRKSKAPAPAKQQQREADQVEDKAAK